MATPPSVETLQAINTFKNTIIHSKSPFRTYINGGNCLSSADDEVFLAAVNAAYNDAARTFTGINGNSDTAKVRLAGSIKAYFESGCPCQTHTAYDDFHDRLCTDFLSSLSQSGYNTATYGQAQKVVNMAFKYLYCLDDAATTYNDYFEYCHVALDSFTLEWIWRNCDTGSLNKYEAWSNLKKGDFDHPKGTYNDTKGKLRPGYDKMVTLYRNKIPSSLYTDCTPFQAEFIFWPEIQMHLATEAFYFALVEGLSNNDKQVFKDQNLSFKKAEVKRHL